MARAKSPYVVGIDEALAELRAWAQDEPPVPDDERPLSVDELRTLSASSLIDVGAHTRTHVDLGSVTDDEALREILGARWELEDQLSAKVEFFAYPYGRMANLIDANRSLVRAAGFRCCCSCFGGVNVPGSDPFELKRVPISPSSPSPLQFGFELALGRSIQPA